MGEPYNNFNDPLLLHEQNVLLAVLEITEAPTLTANIAKCEEEKQAISNGNQESNDSLPSEQDDISVNHCIFKQPQIEKTLQTVINKVEFNSHDFTQESRPLKEIRFVTSEIGVALFDILKRKIMKYYKNMSTLNSEPLLSFFVNVCRLPPSQLLNNGGYELKLFHNLYFGNEIPLRLRINKTKIHPNHDQALSRKSILQLMHQSFIGRHVILPEFNNILCNYISFKKPEQAEAYYKASEEVMEGMMENRG